MSETNGKTNGTGRTLIFAVVAALTVPSISAVIVGAQMFQRMAHIEERFDDHGTRPAHGTVGERLTEHDTKFDGQENRDMEQDRRLELIERFASDFYEQKVHFRILRERVNSIHQDEAHR